MWQLRWKIQQLLLTFLVNTRPTCSPVQCSVGGDNYFDKLHSCYYLVLVIVNCRQHTASEEWEHSAQNATPHLILLGFVSRNEAAWGLRRSKWGILLLTGRQVEAVRGEEAGAGAGVHNMNYSEGTTWHNYLIYTDPEFNIYADNISSGVPSI